MSDRKKDHIDMAFASRTTINEKDNRFLYEPLLAAHHNGEFESFEFAGKKMSIPVWISSMTGGTEMAGAINRNLATACGEFGMGMGLGSCRTLLESDQHLSDFDVRQYMGPEVPLYANLGISQLEKLIENNEEDKIEVLVNKLKADGIIIHVNPLQEAFQPEGDFLKIPPIDTIEAFLVRSNLRVIVKEVGQGMGPGSLQRLLSLPLEAIEFGAFGGTNFTKVELNRHSESETSHLQHYGNIGHTATEMTSFVNNIVAKGPVQCKQLIISGGITNVPDGHFLIKSSRLKSVFGMGSAFLKHAMDDYTTLQKYVGQLKQGLGIAHQFLRLDESS